MFMNKKDPSKEVITVTDYLDSDPDPNDIRVNADGRRYLPIRVVERYLDDLIKCTPAERWHTSDLKVDTLPGKQSIVFSGTIVLTIILEKNVIKRSGAFTMFATGNDKNKDYYPTILSGCIKNAAKSLGRRFGRYLNEEEVKDEDDAVPEQKFKGIKMADSSLGNLSENLKNTLK